jgi:hypothetical protein
MPEYVPFVTVTVGGDALVTWQQETSEITKGRKYLRDITFVLRRNEGIGWVYVSTLATLIAVPFLVMTGSKVNYSISGLRTARSKGIVPFRY